MKGPPKAEMEEERPVWAVQSNFLLLRTCMGTGHIRCINNNIIITSNDTRYMPSATAAGRILYKRALLLSEADGARTADLTRP